MRRWQTGRRVETMKFEAALNGGFASVRGFYRLSDKREVNYSELDEMKKYFHGKLGLLKPSTAEWGWRYAVMAAIMIVSSFTPFRISYSIMVNN